jgi:hypothetical protein
LKNRRFEKELPLLLGLPRKSIQFFVVDDGSLDSTAKMLELYLAKTPLAIGRRITVDRPRP